MRVTYVALFFLFFVFSFLRACDIDQINEIIKLYKRPITFLGVINDDDNLILSLSKLYKDSVFVLLDGKSVLQKDSLPKNFIHLERSCNVNELIHLGECEHFDIVFIKNHFNPLNLHYAQALYNLGENVLVKIEPADRLLAKHLVSLAFKKIQTSTEGSYFFKNHSIKFLRRTQWLQPASDANCVRQIVSTYDKKMLFKHYLPKPNSSVWLPGINLMTFKMLNGRIPSDMQLKNEIRSLYEIPHLDWMPNNMIVQGDHLELIDFENLTAPKAIQNEGMLNLVTNLVMEPRREKIPNLFERVLVYCREQVHGKKKGEIDNGKIFFIVLGIWFFIF